MQIVNNFARELYSPYAFSLRAANKLEKNLLNSRFAFSTKTEKKKTLKRSAHTLQYLRPFN